MTPWTDIAGNPASGLLLIADHASARVPDGIALGVPDALMGEHIAIDIGVAPLARALCAGLDCPGVLGDVSRLVIDLNRDEDGPGLIVDASDGVGVPGNVALSDADRARRIELFWRPYHDHLSRLIAANQPNMLISLHSFTPRLRDGGAERPWEIGILYNTDDRAARIAMPALAQAGVMVGDNLPYSGTVLNATMNRHGETRGIAYLGIEVRQDLLVAPGGVDTWSARLAKVIGAMPHELFGCARGTI